MSDARELEAQPEAVRLYFAGCAALIGFVLCYILPVYARLPRLFYDPLARRWSVAISMGPIPMGYLGQVLWGIGGAALGFALASIVVRRLGRAPSPRGYGLWAAWTLSALALSLAYFAWNNWP